MDKILINKLKSLPCTEVEGSQYLSHQAAAEAVAFFLFPETGPQSAGQMKQVERTTYEALPLAGFTPRPVTLKPPQVPYGRHGDYWRRLPPLDMAAVRTALPGITQPYNGSPREFFYLSDLARHFPDQIPSRQTAAADPLKSLLEKDGWTLQTNGLARYEREQRFDAAKAAQTADALLSARQDAVWQFELTDALCRGGYGRAIPGLDPTTSPSLLAALQEALDRHGYQYQKEITKYYAKPLSIPIRAKPALAAALGNLEPTVVKGLGPCLTLPQITRTVLDHTDLESAGAAPLQQAIAQEWPGGLLIELGYDPKPQLVPARDCTPPPESQGARLPVFPRLVQVTPVAEPKRQALGDAGTVARSTVAVMDEEEDTIVALQLLGESVAVRSNWAGLVNGRARHYIEGAYVELPGMKGHFKLEARLPCGWKELWLVHKQASYREMNPALPFFYLLDDGRTSPPPGFILMLDKAIDTPVLPAWAQALWAAAVRQKLARLCHDHAYGMAAWKVLAAGDRWQAIISQGLESGALTF